MTKQGILGVFKDEFNSIIRNCERAIEKYSLGMNEDYEYFYRWHSGDMYKAVVRLQFFRALRPIIDCDSAEGITVMLNQHIGNIERELIDGRQYPGGRALPPTLPRYWRGKPSRICGQIFNGCYTR